MSTQHDPRAWHDGAAPSPAERLAREATHFMGSTAALLLSTGVIGVWFVTGLLFGFSSVGPQLIEDGIQSVTFVMVFIIQRAQNKDTLAIQLKLNELIASSPSASNQVLNAEDISEPELELLRRHFRALDALARREGRLRGSLLVDDIDEDDLDEDARRR